MAVDFSGVPLSRTVTHVRGADNCAFFCSTARMGIGRRIDLGIGRIPMSGTMKRVLGNVSLSFRIADARVTLFPGGDAPTRANGTAAVVNGIMSRGKRPVVKTGILMTNAAANIVASVSNGCGLRTPFKSSLRVSCVNCAARAIGTKRGSVVGVGRSSGALRRIMIMNCNMVGGGSLAKTITSLGTDSLRGRRPGAIRSVLHANITKLSMNVRASAGNGADVVIHNGGGLHTADASGSSLRPLVMLSKMVCSKRVASVGPGSVRRVSMLGSTDSATICNTGTTGNIILVAAGGKADSAGPVVGFDNA